MESVVSFVVAHAPLKDVTAVPESLLIALRGSLSFGHFIDSIEGKRQSTGKIWSPVMKRTRSACGQLFRVFLVTPLVHRPLQISLHHQNFLQQNANLTVFIRFLMLIFVESSPPQIRSLANWIRFHRLS